MDKKIDEMYFAVNKNTKEIFNSSDFYKNKISYAKIGHLKGIFTRYKLDINEYDFYKVIIENGIPILVKEEI